MLRAVLLCREGPPLWICVQNVDPFCVFITVKRVPSRSNPGKVTHTVTCCVAMATAKVAVFRITVDERQVRPRSWSTSLEEDGSPDTGEPRPGEGNSRTARITEVCLQAFSQREAFSYPQDAQEEYARLYACRSELPMCGMLKADSLMRTDTAPMGHQN